MYKNYISLFLAIIFVLSISPAVFAGATNDSDDDELDVSPIQHNLLTSSYPNAPTGTTPTVDYILYNALTNATWIMNQNSSTLEITYGSPILNDTSFWGKLLQELTFINHTIVKTQADIMSSINDTYNGLGAIHTSIKSAGTATSNIQQQLGGSSSYTIYSRLSDIYNKIPSSSGTSNFTSTNSTHINDLYNELVFNSSYHYRGVMYYLDSINNKIPSSSSPITTTNLDSGWTVASSGYPSSSVGSWFYATKQLLYSADNNLSNIDSSIDSINTDYISKLINWGSGAPTGWYGSWFMSVLNSIATTNSHITSTNQKLDYNNTKLLDIYTIVDDVITLQSSALSSLSDIHSAVGDLYSGQSSELTYLSSLDNVVNDSYLKIYSIDSKATTTNNRLLSINDYVYNIDQNTRQLEYNQNWLYYYNNNGYQNLSGSWYNSIYDTLNIMSDVLANQADSSLKDDSNSLVVEVNNTIYNSETPVINNYDIGNISFSLTFISNLFDTDVSVDSIDDVFDDVISDNATFMLFTDDVYALMDINYSSGGDDVG